MDEIDAFFEDCFEDRLEIVAARIQENPGLIHSRRIGGRTPLHQTAFGGGQRVAALLIASGSDVNATNDYGWVPLHYAAAPLSAGVAELLLRNGATPGAANDNGSTPLHFAVDYGKLSMVELLLLHGAAVNTHDHDERTPLDFAASDSEIAQLLRAKGALPGTPAPAAKSNAEMPEWLKGHEGEIGQLLDTVQEQWNPPSRPQTGERQDKPREL